MTAPSDHPRITYQRNSRGASKRAASPWTTSSFANSRHETFESPPIHACWLDNVVADHATVAELLVQREGTGQSAISARH
jgi:hypothetical protein